MATAYQQLIAVTATMRELFFELLKSSWQALTKTFISFKKSLNPRLVSRLRPHV
jgi:hypothetical protein